MGVLTLEIQSRHIQVKEATMEIVAELRGLRYIMHRHPWISAFAGVGSLAMLVMIILVSWTRFLTGDSSTRTNNRSEEAEVQAEDQETEENLDDDAVEEVPVVAPARASRGILRSIFRFFVINS